MWAGMTSRGCPCWACVSGLSQSTALPRTSVSRFLGCLKTGSSHDLLWGWLAWLDCSQIPHRLNLELALVFGLCKMKESIIFTSNVYSFIKCYLDNEEKQKEKEKKITHRPTTQTKVPFKKVYFCVAFFCSHFFIMVKYT